MSNRNNTVFFIIVAVFSLYAILFIIRTSFVIEGERYFSLFDDAMISMRYAKNLAAGHGLVWNPGGERVEGFTNPLWVIIMAGIHLFPVPPSKVSLIVQLVAALILLINLVVIKKVAESISNASPFVVLGSVFLTGFYLPLNNWSLQGMEVGLLTLIISLSTLNAIKCLKHQTSPVWLYALIGIGILVRLDMVVMFISILIFFILFDSQNRRKHLWYGFTMLAIIIIPQTLARLWYYNDILPNTYYLKMTGFPVIFRISRGLKTLVSFLFHLNIVFFMAFLGAWFLVRQKTFLLLVWIFLTQVLYHIYVGGDAWESWGSRYITIVMPIFFLLLCTGIYKLNFIKYLEFMGEKINTLGIIIISLVFLLFCSINLNLIDGSVNNFFLLWRPLHINDHIVMVKQSLLINELTDDSAKIAVVWAGIIPYFADRYFIDLLGKNDRKIARQDMRIASGFAKYYCFYPGHSKWDYCYSIGQLKPDVVMQIWDDDSVSPIELLESYKYLHQEYEEFQPPIESTKDQAECKKIKWYLRRESHRLIWEKIKL